MYFQQTVPQDTLTPVLPERLSGGIRLAAQEIQHTLCEICGDQSDKMDYRLTINVARTLGPAAMLRAFTPDAPRWLCRSCHRRKTRHLPGVQKDIHRLVGRFDSIVQRSAPSDSASPVSCVSAG